MTLLMCSMEKLEGSWSYIIILDKKGLLTSTCESTACGTILVSRVPVITLSSTFLKVLFMSLFVWQVFSTPFPYWVLWSLEPCVPLGFGLDLFEGSFVDVIHTLVIDGQECPCAIGLSVQDAPDSGHVTIQPQFFFNKRLGRVYLRLWQHGREAIYTMISKVHDFLSRRKDIRKHICGFFVSSESKTYLRYGDFVKTDLLLPAGISESAFWFRQTDAIYCCQTMDPKLGDSIAGPRLAVGLVASGQYVVFPYECAWTTMTEVLRFNEIYKFCDGMLTRILKALDYRVKEFKSYKDGKVSIVRIVNSVIGVGASNEHIPTNWYFKKSLAEKTGSSTYVVGIWLIADMKTSIMRPSVSDFNDNLPGHSRSLKGLLFQFLSEIDGISMSPLNSELDDIEKVGTLLSLYPTTKTNGPIVSRALR
ncbi:hypothetical protein Tco_1576134 [Tanacetum coccineum]